MSKVKDDKEMNIEKKETDQINKTERTRSGKVFVPSTDIVETENEIHLYAEIPGADKKSIDVVLENNELTIQANVQQEHPTNYQNIYSEYEIGDYYRSFRLSDVVDQENIEAQYKNGVLNIILRKSEKAKPRQIEVKVG